MARRRPPRKPRYPLGPLTAWVERRWPDAKGDPERFRLLVGDVGPSTLRRWRAEGMTLRAADRACTALGVHVSVVWGEIMNREDA